MLRAVLTLSAIEDTERNEVIDLLRDSLSSGAPRDAFWFSHRRPEALQALTTAAEQDGLERISEVRQALEGVEVAEPGE